MKFNQKDILYVFIIIFIVLINYYNLTKINNMNNKFNLYENTIKALNDSIHITVKNGITEYSKLTPEIDLTELTNTEYFKTLSKKQQEYYLELSKIKGLIASTNAELSKQGEVLDKINQKQNPGKIDNDSIKFKLGTVLNFNEKDTSKNLQWNSSILLDKNIDFKFNYNYNVKIITNYERQKDKSIVVKYKIDDPELKVNNLQNFIIPVDEKKTKFGKWFDKNKRPIYTTIGGLIFIGGSYVGYNLAK